MSKTRARFWAIVGATAAAGMLCLATAVAAPWWAMSIVTVNMLAQLVLSGVALRLAQSTEEE